MMAFLKSAALADELAQHRPLVDRFAPGRHEILRHRRRRRRRRRHLDPHRIGQEGIGEALDFRRHGRREEQRLAGEGQELADPLDVRDEAHVEHAVGLVDDQNLDAGHQELAALEMIEQPAGRGDQHVGAAVELLLLVVEGYAADQKRHRKLVVAAVFVEILLDLRGKFARRLEDQRARHARPRPAAFQQR